MAMKNAARNTRSLTGYEGRPTDPYSTTNQHQAQIRENSGRKDATISSKYDTTRGQSILWTEEDERKHQVRAHVSDTRALQACKQWVDIVGRGVTHLTLEDDDSVFTDIPLEITQLQTLRSLTLLWSQVKVIPSHVFKMALREIRMQDCPLKSAEGIQVMTSLASLELSNTNLKKIPLDIGRMNTLVNLNLSGNSIKAIPVSIGNLDQLKLLNLCANSIAEVPDEITQLIKLESIDMSQNNIRELPADIGNLSKLITIRLSHNQLADLPTSFVQLVNLKHLFLSNNKFKILPRLLGKLPELLTLNMAANQIADIPASVRTLTTLLLDKNEFTELPDPLFLCDKLENLSLQKTGLDVIPPLIDRLVSLRALNLGGNNLTKLPDELCHLTQLRHLVIRENDIDDLPVLFDSLENLNILDLNQTKICFEYKNALQEGGVGALMREIAHQRHLRLPQKKEKVNKPRTSEGTFTRVPDKPKVAEPIGVQSQITHNNPALITLNAPPPPEREQTIGRQQYRNVPQSWRTGQNPNYRVRQDTKRY